MADDKKQDGFSGKWAIVTLHPWLPSKSEQIARARTWGVDERWLDRRDVSALFVDDARKVGRTTNWPANLPERAQFIEMMNSLQHRGDQVFFANPLCVGFSAKHAQHTVEALFSAGLEVYVHTVKDNGSALYREGDDMAEFYETVGAMANAAHQRQHRARKS